MTNFDNLEERRVDAHLRDDARLHVYQAHIDLLIRDGREVVKEQLTLLCGVQIPDGEYELHYNWLGEPRGRMVGVVGGRLGPISAEEPVTVRLVRG
jgi:hypothetical protein